MSRFDNSNKDWFYDQIEEFFNDGGTVTELLEILKYYLEGKEN